MATASAGKTGSLSTTDMRTLLKATDEIEAFAVTTAMHLKTLTDRSDGSKQLLESVEPGGLWAVCVQESHIEEALALQSTARALQEVKASALAAGDAAGVQALLGLWDSSPWKATRDGPEGMGTAPTLTVSTVTVVTECAVKQESAQKATPKVVAVRAKVKLEGSADVTPKQEGSTNRKRRLAAHRAMTAGKAVVPVQHKRPRGMLALMEENWNAKEHCPTLLHVGWERKRKNEKPKMPADHTERAEFALELADAYALRSKEKATWKAYSEWWKTFLCIAECFNVAEEGNGGEIELTYGWEESVEAMRKAVALMALEYAESTIDIMVSAVGFYFNKMIDDSGVPWKPPHEEPNFKATLEGIKRDIGTRKRK